MGSMHCYFMWLSQEVNTMCAVMTWLVISYDWAMKSWSCVPSWRLQRCLIRPRQEFKTCRDVFTHISGLYCRALLYRLPKPRGYLHCMSCAAVWGSWKFQSFYFNILSSGEWSWKRPIKFIHGCSPSASDPWWLERGTLCPSDIGNKWKTNVSVAKMNDVHILRKIIEIRDGFKECCILSKEDVSDIIENLTGFFNLY